MVEFTIPHEDFQGLTREETIEKLVEIGTELQGLIKETVGTNTGALETANLRFVNLIGASFRVLSNPDVTDEFIYNFFVQLDWMNLGFKGKHL